MEKPATRGMELERKPHLDRIVAGFIRDGYRLDRKNMPYFLDNIIGDINRRTSLFCEIIRLNKNTWGMCAYVDIPEQVFRKLLDYLPLEALKNCPIGEVESNESPSSFWKSSYFCVF